MSLPCYRFYRTLFLLKPLPHFPGSFFVLPFPLTFGLLFGDHSQHPWLTETEKELGEDGLLILREGQSRRVHAELKYRYIDITTRVTSHSSPSHPL